jgi:hypothetical protein
VAISQITKRLIDSLKPRPDEYFVWDSSLSGFGVRVQSTGAMSYVSNRFEPRPPFACKDDPAAVCECFASDGAETGGAEPHVAEQSRSWRAASGVQEVMRGS